MQPAGANRKGHDKIVWPFVFFNSINIAKKKGINVAIEKFTVNLKTAGIVWVPCLAVLRFRCRQGKWRNTQTMPA